MATSMNRQTHDHRLSSCRLNGGGGGTYLSSFSQDVTFHSEIMWASATADSVKEPIRPLVPSLFSDKLMVNQVRYDVSLCYE